MITLAAWGIYGLATNNLHAREPPAKKIPKVRASTNGVPPSPPAPLPDPVAAL